MFSLCTVKPPDLYDPSFNRDFTAKKVQGANRVESM